MKIALWLHVLGMMVWVGGMFFAYMALRPAAAQVLQPAQRLPLWAATFARFFPWVWASATAILTSGLYMVWVMGGFKGAPLYVHLMFVIGSGMMLIFAHVFFSPYARLKRFVAAQDWPEAGKALNQIRFLVGLNLVLGLVTVTVATALTRLL